MRRTTTTTQLGLLATLTLLPAGGNANPPPPPPPPLTGELQLEPVPCGFRDLRRSQEATVLPLSQDEEGVLLAIGFDFHFYGQTYTQLAVTTNGYLTFGTAVNPLEEPLPSAFPSRAWWTWTSRSGSPGSLTAARTRACTSSIAPAA